MNLTPAQTRVVKAMAATAHPILKRVFVKTGFRLDPIDGDAEYVTAATVYSLKNRGLVDRVWASHDYEITPAGRLAAREAR